MVLVFLAWALLFLPAFLADFDARSLLLVLLSAALLWPLSTPRLLPWSVAILALLGAGNLVHISHFGYLVDEYLVATALRTNWQEALEFGQAVSLRTAASVALWLLACLGIGLWLHQRAPAARQSSRSARWITWAATAFWLLYAVFGAVKHFGLQDYAHGLRYVYPLQAVRAVVSQQAMADATFYTPQMETIPMGPPAADTVVVVLGESASAQRWSLLGYTGAATNAPLQGIPQLQAATVLAHGVTTAEALPFLLTARSAHDSATQQLPSFLDLAQSADYKVFAFNNSRYNNRREDFYAQVLRRSADVFQQAGDGDYDEVLTPYLEAALNDPAPRKLIVLHTYGSHPSLTKRVPPTQTAVGDAYDTTIHYTSQLLAQWIQLTEAAHTNGTAMLLYSSDHGLVLPPCPSAIGTGSSRSSVQVPLLVWANERLRSRQQALATAITQATEQPMATSNAELARLAALAIGATPISPPPLEVDGKPWSTLKTLDACSQDYAGDVL